MEPSQIVLPAAITGVAAVSEEETSLNDVLSIIDEVLNVLD
jgi:hypothetical protein